MPEFLKLDMGKPVAVLWLNRPPINALDETALKELVEAVD